MTRPKIVLLKIAVWIGGLLPLGRLIYKGLTGGLGANPIEFITLSTGTWTLVFLLTTLERHAAEKACRPGLADPDPRLVGLFAFFYASLHFMTFIWLDKFFDLQDMIKDVMKRRFITAGFLAFMLLVPLALTSTTWAIRIWEGKTGSGCTA